jgi:GTP-binding protein EngB required for normal cell division
MTPEQYKAAREKILSALENTSETVQSLRIKDGTFFSGIPAESQQRFMHVDRDITRLRQPNLTVAFVGGFSAGKSSLVNAFLGRYLLPESTEVTTAVPTFIRAAEEDEFARLSYLSQAEVAGLEELYREALADKFKLPELANMPAKELIERVRPLTAEGKGKELLNIFEIFLKEKSSRDIPERGLQKDCSLADMASSICDEREAMFLDRVEVFVKSSGIPSDVQIVDLPGISVPNPRHARLTYRFVTQDAHALIFVLRSTQLFNKDELEILEKIRSGDSSIAEKTFWVLNRWDALSEQQQSETLAGFRNRMKEYSIPDSYVMMKTNALHGLLAQLALRGEEPVDPKLKIHNADYLKRLTSDHGGDHSAALRVSEIQELQREVLSYLNDRIRQVTLKSAVENSMQNLILPLLHHLNTAKQSDEQLVQGELETEQRSETRRRTDQCHQKRKLDLAKCFESLRRKVAIARGQQFADGEEKIASELREQVDSGKTTDAFEVYQSIIANNRLRTFPYYFEIEMKVVDGLNTVLKERFRELVRTHVSKVLDGLTEEIRNQLESFSKDVDFDSEITGDLKRVLNESRDSLLKQVDGVVKEKAGHLDSLLVYKPKGFWTFFGSGNEIVDGLERHHPVLAGCLRVGDRV